MDELCLITTSRKSPLCTLCFVFEVVPCKSSSRPSRERRSRLTLSPMTRSPTSRPRYRIKREFLQNSSDSFLQESSWKMDAHCPTTTSRKSLLFTWCFDFEVDIKRHVFFCLFTHYLHAFQDAHTFSSLFSTG